MTEYNSVAVLGAGSWGIAIARLLDSNGSAVRMWEFDSDEYAKLIERRSLPEKLPGITIPDSIQITNDLDAAVADAELVVLVVPSQSLRPVVRRLAGKIGPEVGLVNLAKGIETESLCRMSEVILQELNCPRGKVATLSGPSHAEEVARDILTTVVVGAHDEGFAARLQRQFSTASFRVYTSDDVIGVELGGALKNIVAIGVGITDGLGMGDNTRGALITRGLAELTRLGVTLGARPETFAGLSGIGDLITTCTSQHSRNRFVGEKIGGGMSLEQVLESMSMVAEGVQTTRSGSALARQYQVEMPITEQVYKVLFEDKSAATAAEELMGRQLKAEVWR